MKAPLQIVTVVVLLGALAGTANGQRHTSAGHRIPVARRNALPQQTGAQAVPGLGFDYAHLAAINKAQPDLALRAVVDPATQQRLGRGTGASAQPGAAAGAIFFPSWPVVFSSGDIPVEAQ